MILILSSCSSTSFYQVYDVKPASESITKSDVFFYEDENCKISYNLWSNGGNIGFNFYNKSESKIYLKLNESYFIKSGFAYDYFQNRTFTTSESKSALTSKTLTNSTNETELNIYNNRQKKQAKSISSTNLSSSVGYAVSIKEDSIVCIPPKTSKLISEFSINDAIIRDCDLYKYPKTKEINTVSFKENESPIVFSNRITYVINSNINEVNNEFYVSKITNYPESKFFETKFEEYCGQKSSYPSIFFKHYDNNKFYIKYSKGTDYWKH